MKYPVIKYLKTTKINLEKYRSQLESIFTSYQVVEDNEEHITVITPERYLPFLKNKLYLLYRSLKKSPAKSASKTYSFKVGIKGKESAPVPSLRNLEILEDCHFKLFAHESLPCKVIQIPLPISTEYVFSSNRFDYIYREPSFTGTAIFILGGEPVTFVNVSAGGWRGAVTDYSKTGYMSSINHSPAKTALVAVASTNTIPFASGTIELIGEIRYTITLIDSDEVIEIIRSYSSDTPALFSSIGSFLDSYLIEKKIALDQAETTQEGNQLRADELAIEYSFYGRFYRSNYQNYTTGNTLNETQSSPINIYIIKFNSTTSNYEYQYVATFPSGIGLSIRLYDLNTSVRLIQRGPSTSADDLTDTDERDAKRLFDYVDSVLSQ